MININHEYSLDINVESYVLYYYNVADKKIIHSLLSIKNGLCYTKARGKVFLGPCSLRLLCK